MKSHSLFICQQCGYKSPSFLGKCPNCESWNSLVETREEKESVSWTKENKRERTLDVSVQKLDDVQTTIVNRISTGLSEVDQLLSGIDVIKSKGIVPGSLILLAGDPGIGKSTLTLQILSFIGCLITRAILL